MHTAPGEGPNAGLIRFLKILVSAMAATMLVGLIVLIALFVMRFPSASTGFPAEIALPEGTSLAAVTRGPDWLAVVTQDGRLLVYSADGQRLLQEVEITQAR
ncbi:MAG TPA: hypothetical protein ENK83_02735 [Aliiroseovarius sp.]|nr:hypothetical protein [Aliiroseovarius sp.]